MINCPGKRNGFPFVLGLWSDVITPPEFVFGDPEEFDNQSAYPVVQELAEASCVFWRVREWKIVWSENGGSAGGTTYYRPVAAAGSPPYYRNHEINEANLCHAISFAWEEFNRSTTNSPQTFPSFRLEKIGKRDDTDVRLKLTLRMADSTSEPLSSNRAWDENVLQANITATISDGTSDFVIPVYYVQSTTPNEYFSSATTYEITPHKYWTYGGKYDEDTGELV